MAVRRPTGPSFGGGRMRPADNQQAGSLRPTTNGSGRRNNGWNGHGKSNLRHYNQDNRSHNFIHHQPVHHFGEKPRIQPQKCKYFRQAKSHRYPNQQFQTYQGGDFNAPKHVQHFQNNAGSENPVQLQTGFQDHLRAPAPRGPKNRNNKWRNRRNQVALYSAVHDIEMFDASNIDTDIEMPDAPPLESYNVDNWINEPVSQVNFMKSKTANTYSNNDFNQTLLVADGLASANAMLSRIEYFVRTGTMPADNFTLSG
ncbi:uncharacterized protein N7458_004750 [Penicillium daleae]|uniref:Uncharacterized protein n=1 Tax=Penicillium daleae TaxID=63821 RepID=A0AAD6C738_9EURO|nr:uncharacterized protein N7458_004750 [Penicillium daleae]KAJ5453794.1 hypothetical protein N7458_004750 [Penicillium daleae]